MKTKHFLIALLIVLSIVFLWFIVIDNDVLASGFRAALIISFVVLYVTQVSTKNKYFLLFLIFYGLAQLLDFLSYFILINLTSRVDYIYFIGNGLNILAYSLLILKVLKSMDIKDVVIKLPAHIVILVVLDIFCVTIVTDTAREALTIYEFSLEFLYNTVIMTLLTIVVINYIHKVNKKAMNLLLGSLFIVFSEMIQLAYFYVIEDKVILNVFCSVFLIIAFFFLFLQASMEDSEELSTYKEQLEA